MNKNKTVLIVAGGKGERMQTDLPKQFIEIAGKPILMHSIEAFANYDTSIQIVLVLPADQQIVWSTLCKKYNFEIPHQVVLGGNSRFQSVKNGLSVVDSSTLVAVHDGVRPLVSAETIERCFETAETYKAVIPVVDVVDSIRQISNNISKSVDRNTFKLVQTPQVFDATLLKNAYEQGFSPLFTDDASVLEKMGVKVKLVEGNRENIKITTAYDLAIAELFLSQNKD
jgi:2-C-methyl-D-erythritol 4-phosphate cytidylyltransferase